LSPVQALWPLKRRVLDRHVRIVDFGALRSES
jgi:hypothetical protein